MKLKSVLLMFVLFGHIQLTAQEIPESGNYGNTLKITLLRLVDLANPGLELSYEKRITNHYSVELSALHLFPKGLLDGDFSPHTKGYRLGLENKYYLSGQAPAGTYLGVELNYLKNRYQATGRFGEDTVFSDSLDTNYADTFQVKKQVISLNFKIGYVLIRHRLSVDLYAGLGLRYRMVQHFDRLFPEDEMEQPIEPNFYDIKNQEGNNWRICIPLNVKIGWLF